MSPSGAGWEKKKGAPAELRAPNIGDQARAVHRSKAVRHVNRKCEPNLMLNSHRETLNPKP